MDFYQIQPIHDVGIFKTNANNIDCYFQIFGWKKINVMN
jgi:hypothetical protein